MARPRRRRLNPSDIEGLEYFDTLVPCLARLKDIGTERDRAGNRQLFYDQYISLLLLYFFNPTITSLRGLQQASTLETVQRRLGIRATSLGSFSEAARVFDAEALHANPARTGRQSRPRGRGTGRQAIVEPDGCRWQYLSGFPPDGLGLVERRPASRRQAASAFRRFLQRPHGCRDHAGSVLRTGPTAGHAATGTVVRL